MSVRLLETDLHHPPQPQLPAELQLPPEIRQQITIEHRRTDGGYLIVQVPLNLVNLEDVAVDPKWVKELARKMEAEKRLLGGTGQIDPIQFGLPSGAKRFEVLDGHHRAFANEERDAPYHLGTVRPNCTYENVYDSKLEHSTRVPLLFTRANYWVGRSFAYSGLSDRYTPEQAFAHYLGIDQSKWRDIDPEDLVQMHSWVDRKSVTWNKKPERIYDYLLKGQGVTKKVIDMARGSQGGRSEGLTPTHVGNISEVLADAPAEIQIAVAEHARDEKLSAFDTWELARLVQKAPSVEAVYDILTRQDSEPTELSDYEKRERRIDSLTRTVITGVSKFAEGKTLTLMSPREQIVNLLVGNTGTAAEYLKRSAATQTLDKYQPDLVPNERIITSIDFRRFRELIDRRDRHALAEELLVDSLGFNLDLSTRHGLYPNTVDGVDWIKMAHPSSNLIARCFGKNGADQEYSIDGVHLIYSEGYQGIHAIQTKTQSEKTRPNGSKPRRIVSAVYGNPNAGKDDTQADQQNGNHSTERRNGHDKKGQNGNGQKSDKEGITQHPSIKDLYPLAPPEIQAISPNTRFRARSGGRLVDYTSPNMDGDKVYVKDVATGTTTTIGAEAFLKAFEEV